MRNGGPVTEVGKATSSRNATRHGILAMLPVVPGMEQEAEWEAHRAGIFDSLAPDGHLEELLTDRIALQLWRLRRVARYEAGTIADAQETAADDVTGRWAHLESETSALRQQLEDARTLQTESRQLLDRLKQLKQQVVDALLMGREPPDVDLPVGEATVQEPPGEASIRIFPDGKKIVSWPGWTTADLREYVAALERVEKRMPRELWQEMQLSSPQELDRLRQTLAEMMAGVEQFVNEMKARVRREQRERLLPSETILEKVVRYEAHLSREFYKALHELEALQARRRGQPAPLARLDVTGLPAG